MKKTLLSRLKKGAAIGLILAFFLSFELAVFSFAYLFVFFQEAKIERSLGLKEIWTGLKNPYSEKYLNFLILGLDKRESENTLLTDTIILTTINTASGDYRLISVPRDLWLEDLKTKINTLYYYGQKSDPNDGTKMVRGRIEEIFGVKIDYVFVLEMNDVARLIDLIGGIDLIVDESFTDEEFPKDDGSDEVMTVSFTAGENHFNGERALQFIRSRKSKNEKEGSDLARQTRQKKVILAIKNKLISSKKIFLDPEKVADLYLFLTERVKSDPRLDLGKIVSFWKVGAKVLGGKQIDLELKWEGPQALLEAGRDPYYKSWILLPKKDNWQVFREFLKSREP